MTKDEISVYGPWLNMLDRCRRKDKIYYGGKGITAYKPWENFNIFLTYVLENLGPRPEGMSLDRIDSEGNYEPNNIRWATYKDQARNRSSNVEITIAGETKCKAAWAEGSGLTQQTIRQRVVRGMSYEEALETPLKRNTTYLIGDEHLTVSDISVKYNIPKHVINKRLAAGWAVENLIKPKASRNMSLTVNGETKTISEWAKTKGLDPRTIYQRLERGSSPEECISTENLRIITYTILGETKSLGDWCKLYNRAKTTIQRRLNRGLSIEEALGVAKPPQT